jgi:hypothetical protein
MTYSGAKPVKMLIKNSSNQWVAFDGAITAGDIAIGQVEIKDYDSDDQLEITSANAAKVDGSAVVQPVKDDKASSAGTNSGVTVGSSSTTVLAANADRKEAILVNDSDEEMYLKYGTTAVANSGIRLNAYGGNLVETVYTGIITGICASGGKVITVIEA